MAKAGRKRKNVSKREKNGRAARGGRGAERDRVMAVALAQRRRAGLDGGAERDSRAESPIGRLAIRGVVSEAEWMAAERLRSRRAAFLAELARPVRLQDHLAGGRDLGPATPGPRSGGSIGGLAVAREVRTEDVESPKGRPETPAERRERVQGQWAEAKAAALAACGGSRAGLRLLLDMACDLVEPRTALDVVVVVAALKRLGAHWGFKSDEGRKGEPGLAGLRLALDGREAWRFPKAKNRGTGAGDA